MNMLARELKKLVYLVLFVFALLVGCATTGPKPLSPADLDRIGWDKTASFQCFLSSQLILTRMLDNSPAEVAFDASGSARILERRGTIVLPSSLQGRILSFNKRDLYLYVAFEEGDAVLPFAKDKDGRFSLMPTIDVNSQGQFVEYEGSRYTISSRPHLNVVISETQADLRREMGGSQVRAASRTEEVVGRISEKFIDELPEGSVIAVLNISSSDKASAVFIADELEFRLSNSKQFKIVDRKSLDAVRSEQQFQLSGEVSDESARSIGNLLGATIVITGSISGDGSSRRLTIKALDVESAEIISTAREAF
jgi:TolB-like protein